MANRTGPLARDLFSPSMQAQSQKGFHHLQSLSCTMVQVQRGAVNTSIILLSCLGTLLNFPVTFYILSSCHSWVTEYLILILDTRSCIKPGPSFDRNHQTQIYSELSPASKAPGQICSLVEERKLCPSGPAQSLRHREKYPPL